MSLSIISLFLGIVSFLLGLTVLVRDGNKGYNRVFFLVALFSAFWSITFSFIEVPSDVKMVDLLNRLAYVFGYILMLLTVLFTYFFPKRQKIKSYIVYLVFTLPVLVLSGFSPIAGTVSTAASGGFVFNYGSLAFLYTIGMCSGALMIFRNGIILRKNSNILEKTQMTIILFGFVMSLIVGVGFSVVLPLFSKGTRLDNLAPTSLIFLVGFTAYAIVRHKLFDFRAVLVRSLSYILAISLFTIVYVGVLNLLKRIVLTDSTFNGMQLVSNVLVGLVIALTYPNFKRYFDRLTTRLFFRDSYNPQDLIDELNQTLVSNVDLGSLLKNSAGIIGKNIKSASTGFYLRETSYFGSRVIGLVDKDIAMADIDTIQYSITKLHKKVHSYSTNPGSVGEAELNDTMRRNDIEVIARLVSTLDYEVKGVGYLFLGPKKSGSPYTQQDFKIIEIISNELVIAIQNALRFEEIEQFNVTLQKKIDDATRELKASNEKLKALDEAKDEFVSMASHQLRTPLTSVKGYLSMVLEEDAGKINDMQKQMLGQALFSSQRMVYLIADLLNVSRLKTGKFTIESKPVYLPDIVETELQQLKDGATAKNITFEYEKPKKFATIDLDETKIRQVIMNFVDNALYYTKTNGKITVELKEKKDSVEFAVKDNGMGVPKDEQHKLFAKFYRAENARKARPDGTGLGLFMAKKVVVAQGGSIIFQSKEGKGSTFGFSFPKNRTMPTTATSDDEKTQKA